MKRKWVIYHLFFSAVILLTNVVHAEPLQKHPRVAELEDELRANASTYLKARFPDRPFLVSVSVDPLRRSTGKQSASDQEMLPYFDPTVEEIRDEWDDPQISLHQLISRTNKISITISLSNTLSDNEAAEVKEALISTMHLIPARDEIVLNYRSWGGTTERWLYPLIAFSIAILFLVGFFLIQRTGVQKIANALTSQKMASQPTPSMAAPTPAMQPQRKSNEGSGVSGGVQLSDPIKAREMMVKFVEQLTKKPQFPTLSTMIMLEKYGSESTSRLGALISELPETIQSKLYSFGSSDRWFIAMNTPGMFSMNEIEIMQRLLREQPAGRSATVEEMIIKIWRLGDKIPDFIRNHPRDVALTVLHALPKGMGISSARKAFPGAWADLLDPNFGPTTIDDKLAKEIGMSAEIIRPLGNIEDFRRQKSETELRDYLLVATPEEEREIYMASRPDAAIHKMRDPFYVVFESEDDLLKDFVPRLTPEQWATALFNVNRVNRKKIQQFLGEKQNFLLMENMKRLDSSTPDTVFVGETRERIATQFKKHALTFKSASDMESQIDDIMKDVKVDAPSEDEDDDKKAA